MRGVQGGGDAGGAGVGVLPREQGPRRGRRPTSGGSPPPPAPPAAERRRLDARARLLATGGRTCTDAELLALVLGAGQESGAAARLAETVLAASGGIARLDRVGRVEGA